MQTEKLILKIPLDIVRALARILSCQQAELKICQYHDDTIIRLTYNLSRDPRKLRLQLGYMLLYVTYFQTLKWKASLHRVSTFYFELSAGI